ncbi:hypothetical protein CYY_006110 [Polysphondylium violaceum]|uniref:Uncharacterized protein n=1 Tax=Polysphondylium violaceum TaxID=133409 RepID=A0A8J4V3H9_9MYCE|nr:hypothetical protein CYY_006110 [Polysphondylium violaceum]
MKKLRKQNSISGDVYNLDDHLHEPILGEPDLDYPDADEFLNSDLDEEDIRIVHTDKDKKKKKKKTSRTSFIFQLDSEEAEETDFEDNDEEEVDPEEELGEDIGDEDEDDLDLEEDDDLDGFIDEEVEEEEEEGGEEEEEDNDEDYVSETETKKKKKSKSKKDKKDKKETKKERKERKKKEKKDKKERKKKEKKSKKKKGNDGNDDNGEEEQEEEQDELNDIDSSQAVRDDGKRQKKKTKDKGVAIDMFDEKIINAYNKVKENSNNNMFGTQLNNNISMEYDELTDGLSSLYESASSETILLYLDNRIDSRKPLFDYIRAMLFAIDDNQDDDLSIKAGERAELIELLLGVIIETKKGLQEKDLTQCMELLLTEIDGLDKQFYRKVINLIAENISTVDKPQKLTLLPKCLELLSIVDPLVEEFKATTIRNISSSSWSKNLFFPIISMLSDILSLGKGNLDLIIQKVSNSMETIHKDDLPSLVNHFLMLSSHGLKGKILFIISEYFSNWEAQQEDIHLDGQILFMESLIIGELNMAMRKDMDLGKEFLKLKLKISCFNIGILLSMIKIPRFKTQAQDLLKTLTTANVKISYELTSKLFLETARMTSHGWDHILESFVYFAIHLINSNALAINETIKSLRLLGKDILFELFQLHDIIQEKVIDEIMTHIITIKSENLQSTWFLLLTRISNENPQSLGRSVPKIKESFDYLQHFSPNTVRQLISAFDPILVQYPSFMNGIFITLKKSMFARDLESRSASIIGFLQILKNLTASNSINNDGSTAVANQYKPLISEIFGIIKRSLTQQANIRTILYSGLEDLVSSCPMSCNSVCELLLSQFDQYIPDSDSNSRSPILLPRCIEIKEGNAVNIIEPFDKLVHCIQFCITKAGESEEPNIVSLCGKFSTFIESVNRADLKDYDMSVSANGSEKLASFCSILIGTLESLIEYHAVRNEPLESILKFFETYTLAKTLQLENQQQIHSNNISSSRSKKKKDKDADMDQDEDDNNNNNNNDEDDENNNNNNSNGKKGAKPTTTAKKATDSSTKKAILEQDSFSTTCLSNLFSMLSKTSLGERRNTKKFTLFLFGTTHSILQKISSQAKNQKKLLESRKHMVQSKEYYRFFNSIIPSIFHEIFSNNWVESPGSDGSKQKKQNHTQSHSIHTVALQCFDLIIQYVYDNDSYHTMNQLLSPIIKAYNDDAGEIAISNKGVMGSIEGTVKIIQNIIASNIKFESDVEIISSSLSTLCKYLVTNNQSRPAVEDLFNFIKTILQKETILSHSLACHFINLLISIERSVDFTFSKHVYVLLGAIEKDDEVNIRNAETLPIDKLPKRPSPSFNDKTISHIINLLLSVQETTMDKCKEDIIVLKKQWSPSLNEKEKDDISNLVLGICEILHSVCQVLVVLSSCKINGPPREKFLKSIKKFFLTLISLVSMITLYTMHTESLNALILLSSLLSSNTQDFMHWTDNSINENSKSTTKLSVIDKARINRESKLMPIITFTLEKYESTVIKYEKKLKITKHLGKHFKQSKSREFVIETDLLSKKLNNEDENDNNNDSDPDYDENVNSKSKKRKVAAKPKASTSKKQPATKKRK